jgi:eukaryotic-like serine/threonine-protein kinase
MQRPPGDSGPSAPSTALIDDRRKSRDAILDFSRLKHETARFVGATLCDQYQLLEIIGEGGMGVVFRARQIAVQRDVAVKVLHRRLANDDRSVSRFENEARAISKLRHPNTLRLYDCQRTPDGDIFIVTELLTGKPLSRLLFEEGSLPLDRALHVTDHICRSLSEAHAEGIIHRDLKPENVFLDRVGSEEMIKVLDFGIAKIAQDNHAITLQGFISGTPLYMSPEQARGMPIDARSDIYTLGVLLYEMITGHPPFMAENGPQICAMHVTAPPPPLEGPDLGPRGPDVQALIHRMMAKNPEERPASVDHVRGAIAELLDDRRPSVSEERLPATLVQLPPPAPSAMPIVLVDRPASTLEQSNRLLMAGAIAATLISIVAIVLIVMRPEEPVQMIPAEVRSPVTTPAPVEEAAPVAVERTEEPPPPIAPTPQPAAVEEEEAVRTKTTRRVLPKKKPIRAKPQKPRPSDLLLDVDPDSSR